MVPLQEGCLIGVGETHSEIGIRLYVMFEALSQVVSLQRRKQKMSSQRFFVALPERHGVVGKAEMMLKIVTRNPQGPNILLVAEGPQTLAFQLVKLGEMPKGAEEKNDKPPNSHV